MGFVNLINLEYTFTALNQITAPQFCQKVDSFTVCGVNIYGSGGNQVNFYLWTGIIRDTPPDPNTDLNRYSNFRFLDDSFEFRNNTPPSSFWFVLKSTSFVSDFKVFFSGGIGTWM